MKQTFRLLLILTWLTIGASCSKDEPKNDDPGTDPATIEMEHGYSYYRVTNTTNETVEFWVGSHYGVIENLQFTPKEVYVFKVSTLLGTTIYPHAPEGYYLYSILEAKEQYSYPIIDMTLQDIEIRKE